MTQRRHLRRAADRRRRRRLGQQLHHRRRQVGEGDLLPAQPAREPPGAPDRHRIGNAERRSELQRHADVALHRIVREPRRHGRAVRLGESAAPRRPGSEVGERPVAAEHPLRHAGRAGGEGEHAGVVGLDDASGVARRPCGEPAQAIPAAAGGAGRRAAAAGARAPALALAGAAPEREPEGQARGHRRERLRQLAGGRQVNEAASARERQQVGLAAGRIVGVEQQEDAAGLEHTDHRHHQRRAAVGVDGDHVAVDDAAGAQAVGEPVGLAVEVGIAPADLGIDQGELVRQPPRLGGELLVEGPLPGGAERQLRMRQQRPRPLGQQRERADRALRIGDGLGEHAVDLGQQLGHARAVEEIAVVDQVERHLAADLLDVERHVELRAGRGDGERRHRQAGQAELVAGHVDQVEQHLEQRRPR